MGIRIIDGDLEEADLANETSVHSLAGEIEYIADEDESSVEQLSDYIYDEFVKNREIAFSNRRYCTHHFYLAEEISKSTIGAQSDDFFMDDTVYYLRPIGSIMSTSRGSWSSKCTSDIPEFISR